MNSERTSRRQLWVVMATYLVYVAGVAAANFLMRETSSPGDEKHEMITAIFLVA